MREIVNITLSNIILLSILALSLTSCSNTTTQVKESPNTSLTVTYYGKEVHRRNTRWVSVEELDKIIKKPGEKVFIFGADWCTACNTLRTALKQADLEDKPHWINVGEPWGLELMQIFRKNSIPYMVHIDKDGNLVQGRLGPSQIVMYLLVK